MPPKFEIGSAVWIPGVVTDFHRNKIEAKPLAWYDFYPDELLPRVEKKSTDPVGKY